MRNKDWTLVFFTVLSQLSVGVILCVTWLAGFENDGRFVDMLEPQFKNPVLLALVSIGVATGISLMHLGNPKNAPRSLNNLAGSWVSREILALAVYTISLLAILVMAWNHWDLQYLKYALAASSAFGIIFLWMMTRIYVIPTIPPWNCWYTGLSFVSTAICLGLMISLLLYYAGQVEAGCVVCYAQFMSDPTTRLLVLSLSLVLLLEIVSGFYHQSRLVKMNTGIEEIIFGRGTYFRIFLARMAMAILALLLLAVFLFKPIFLSGDAYQLWNALLLALVVIQALIGRLLFFSSYFRVGV